MINIPVNTANKDWKWKREENYILNFYLKEIWVRNFFLGGGGGHINTEKYKETGHS